MAKVKCNRCEEEVERIAYKYYGKAKQYIDNDGKMWKGRTCPKCVRFEHKMFMRKLRNSKLDARECKVCHTSFVPRRGHQKFCSKPCRTESLNARRRKAKKVVHK
jgi:hypothetical protein